MPSADLANYAFAYVLIGAVIWALLAASGAMDKAFAYSRTVSALVSAGTIFAWPFLAAVFVAGIVQGVRGRRARP